MTWWHMEMTLRADYQSNVKVVRCGKWERGLLSSVSIRAANALEALEHDHTDVTIFVPIPVKLPWIFPRAPLTFNGAPGNIQGNLTGMGTLSCSQVSATHVNIGHLCRFHLRSLNELQWLELKIGYQDSGPCNGNQGDRPYCQFKCSVSELFNMQMLSKQCLVLHIKHTKAVHLCKPIKIFHNN